VVEKTEGYAPKSMELGKDVEEDEIHAVFLCGILEKGEKIGGASGVI
jgi:hypothetical protein